jgi:hypothetical protein
VNEHAKIKEAQYFLSLLPELKNDRDKFIHNLSAFLTAGRSALQYAREEAEGKRKGLRWYDRHVASSKIIRFLKEKRDLNIHVNPVSPNARLTVHIKDVASFSASLLIATIREDGTIKKEELSPVSWSSPSKSEVTATQEYFFPDWAGDGDVIALCEMYLKEIETIIADGVKRGFLTP